MDKPSPERCARHKIGVKTETHGQELDWPSDVTAPCWFRSISDSHSLTASARLSIAVFNGDTNVSSVITSKSGMLLEVKQEMPHHAVDECFHGVDLETQSEHDF